MKVCIINNLYGKNSVGGAETVVHTRALEYKKSGNDVIIITTKASKSPKIEKNNENGLVVYRVYIPNIFYYKDLSKYGFILKLIWHFIDIFNFASARIITKILAEEKPDVVETHNLMGVGYNLKMQNAKCKIKWRHYLHDVQLVEPSGVLHWNHKKDNLAQKIYSKIMKRKFRGVDEVVSPSEFLRKFYEERGFFENAEWVIEQKDTRIQETNNKQITNHKFLYVGSLVKHKGIRILMQAWNMVGAGRDLPTLNIVGDGILRREVEKWASDKNNVKVYGRLEGEELKNIYKKCDTLIFPSICIENNPTVIHEAHEYGLKVIASDTGGVSEIVGENDILVEPGSVDELIKILIKY
ncbi:glycosyltransferase [Patescibacteria group bacterium]|nr:glycosyltransferase [Patescibacteria group bacterium]